MCNCCFTVYKSLQDCCWMVLCYVATVTIYFVCICYNYVSLVNLHAYIVGMSNSVNNTICITIVVLSKRFVVHVIQ